MFARITYQVLKEMECQIQHVMGYRLVLVVRGLKCVEGNCVRNQCESLARYDYSHHNLQTF
jgi:hypothetical protein